MPAAGIDRDHDALRAVPTARGRHELRVLDRRRVDRDLVGPRVQQAADILDPAHASAHREGNEDLLGDRFDHVQDDVALVGARGDVKEREFIGAFAVVATRDLDRIAGIAQADEVDALDHAAGGHVEAGDDALGQHGVGVPADGL